MKATELRIGNLAKEITYSKNGIAEVSKQHFEDIENGEIDLFPIPLTEEWLVKFGFVYDADSLTFDYEYNHFVFYLERDFKDIETFSFDSSFTETKVKYVHQLQNLYFALTNKEL